MFTSLRQSVTALLRESLASSAASRLAAYSYQRWAPGRAGAMVLTGAALLVASGLQAAVPPPTSFTSNSYPTDPTVPPVATGPASVALGDVNNDGKVDLVTANAATNNVSVLIGNGLGSFDPNALESNNTTGTSPYSVALGYINNDSNLDLVTANSGDNVNALSVRFGNGNGTFGTAATPPYAMGNGSIYVALGDLNNDTYLDVVTANYESHTVAVRLGSSGGSFGTANSYPTGTGTTYPTSVALGYLNNDNKLDLVTANSGTNNVGVLINNGDGTFGTASEIATGTEPYSVALGDVDGDGDLDLATANYGGPSSANATLMLGNGGGTFVPVASFSTGAPAGHNPTSVALDDVNGDALADLITANTGTDGNPGSSVSVLLSTVNPLSGIFQGFVSQGPYATGTYPRTVVLGDVNGDDKFELVTANRGPTYPGTGSTVSVLLNTTALALSFHHDQLFITPPPATLGAPSQYVIHYNTQARINANKSWAIWAKNWDVGVLSADLAVAKTVTDCQNVYAPATCFRPSLLGEHDIGETFVYRVFSQHPNPVGWNPSTPSASDNLTVTR